MDSIVSSWVQRIFQLTIGCESLVFVHESNEIKKGKKITESNFIFIIYINSGSILSIQIVIVHCNSFAIGYRHHKGFFVDHNAPYRRKINETSQNISTKLLPS